MKDSKLTMTIDDNDPLGRAMNTVPKITLHLSEEVTLPNTNVENLCLQAIDAVRTTLANDIGLEKDTNFSLRVSDDTNVQALNRDYREKDKPTNVLSFPFNEDMDGEHYLGDIIISVDTTTKEANTQNISVENHFTHLVMHGLLHLLGYDHIEDDEAEEMESIEIEALKSLNINNPYEPIED